MRRILWFRRDLRVDDNPLLSQEADVFPIFIFDTNILGKLKSNDRRVTFIFNAVLQLKKDLRLRGLDLAIFFGKPADVFDWILNTGSYHEVCASGDYDAYARERDRDISLKLPFVYLHDTYIFKPQDVLKNDGTPYLVFTPYYKRSQTIFKPEHMAEYLPANQQKVAFDYDAIHVITASEHTLLPLSLDSLGFEAHELSEWQKTPPGEKLSHFASKLDMYSKNRDFISMDGTSALSTDLRFGTLCIRSLLRWLTLQKQSGINTEPFFRQLIFRDFYAMLLAHYPHLAWENFRYNFKGVEDEEKLNAFITAQTGVPIIDAGVRQLIDTGEMHNRVRMICGSFFTKNLLLPWQWGERFFAEHLMDYDASSNILSWQWCAGTGVDPQPYFRIFNPYTQTAKFDKEGSYIKKYLPNLQTSPAKFFADESLLKQNAISGYPQPIVDHKTSSKQALDYFRSSVP